MIYKDMNDLVNAWFDLLEEYRAINGDDYLEVAKRGIEMEGTKAHKLKQLIGVYFKAQKESEQYGYVGVGCITYAEQALIAAQESD
jgi:hypothetical protein